MILESELEAAWINPSIDAEAAVAMLRPYDVREVAEFIADKRVGKVAYDAPDLIQPVEADEKGQLEMFRE